MNLLRIVIAIIAVIILSNGPHVTTLRAQNQSAVDELPELEELPRPTAAELFKARAFDWLVLKNGRVIVIESITPRPDPLAWVEAIVFDHLRKKPNELRDGEAALEEWREQRLSMDYLNVILRDEKGQREETDFQIHIKYVEKFIHFEDHILNEITRHVKQGELKTAYELLVLLNRRDTLRIREFKKMELDLKAGKAVPKLQVAENTSPDKAFKFDPEKPVPWNKPWPGLAQAHNELLFADARKLMESRQFEDAFVRVEEIHERNKFFNGLRGLAGEVSNELVSQSVQESDYRKARFHISRLTKLYRSHEVAETWESNIEQVARKEMLAGRKLFNADRKSEGVRQIRKALHIWPDSSDIKRVYRDTAGRYQILRVGLVENRPPKNYPFESTDQWRIRNLIARPLMHVDYYRDGTPHYASEYFEDWIPTDLGRRLRFKLKKNREPWKSHPVVTSADVLGTLDRHLQPGAPLFDERLSIFVEEIVPITPFEFSMSLRTIPIRPEALIGLNLGAEKLVSSASTENDSAKSESTKTDQTFNAYVPEQHATGDSVYARKYAEPDNLLDFRVAEIQEQTFTSFRELSRAFARQEIDYIPHLTSKDVLPFREDVRVFVQPYALPESHFLQFHPQSPFFKLPNIRRAMQYILDRQTILENEILEKTELMAASDLKQLKRMSRIVTAPFASTSSGYNKLVQPAGYEPSTATALVFVDRAKLSAIGRPLRVLCSNVKRERNAAKRILESWKRIGIEAEFVTFDEQDTEPVEWDIAYRTTRLQDPLYDLSKLLGLKPHVTTQDLNYLPPWIVRDLQNLDLVSDIRAAQAQLRELHASLAREVIMIPLWEVDEFAIFRKNVRGFPKELVHPYHGIDEWVVQPMTNVE